MTQGYMKLFEAGFNAGQQAVADGVSTTEIPIKIYYEHFIEQFGLPNPHQVVPTSTWQGLLFDEIVAINNKWVNHDDPITFARAIEQALKEKNT